MAKCVLSHVRLIPCIDQLSSLISGHCSYISEHKLRQPFLLEDKEAQTKYRRVLLPILYFSFNSL